MDTNFIRVLDHAQGRLDKPYKVTFLQTERMLAGLNCLLPGQSQPLHEHPAQDKFYFVLEGLGIFTVGDEVRACAAGEMILCPPGVPHGVETGSGERLTFLTVIAPFSAGDK